MEVATSISRIKTLRRDISGTVGFVPTMGYLHKGHLALVRQAKKDNAAAVVSIFVNPTQFGPHEDLNNYPRNLEHDLTLLKTIDTDIVFVPSNEEVYPPGFNSYIEVGRISEPLEGKFRPGHFRGVATVVAKLFNLVEPTRAYFGQKDAQQVLVIQKMASELNMNLEIVVCPTVREADGLAMSSRNVYLNPEEREAATVLYKSLVTAQQIWKNGENSAENIRRKIITTISLEPLATIEYVSVADTKTLDELDIIRGPALVSLAVKIGSTRLIDNIPFK